jgi:hypothetical protein
MSVSLTHPVPAPAPGIAQLSLAQLSLAQLQEAFLALQPRLLLHARIVFRHVRCPQQRADHIAEVIGLCCYADHRIMRRSGICRLPIPHFCGCKPA